MDYLKKTESITGIPLNSIRKYPNSTIISLSPYFKFTDEDIKRFSEYEKLPAREEYFHGTFTFQLNNENKINFIEVSVEVYDIKSGYQLIDCSEE